jgi:DNA-binding NarL/FixJ family response regulator
MANTADILSRARTAYERGDWDAAYRDLKLLRDRQALGAEDLYALGDAAWWLGLVRETFAVSEECYQGFLAEGRVSRAAMTALGLGFVWMARGEATIGAAWIGRARRLLEHEPEGMEHGILVWLDANEALESGDLDRALVDSRLVQDLGHRFASTLLVTLGLMTEGTVSVRSGDLQRGFALLDEAMLPVLAGQLPPDWAGNAYCQMVAVCCEFADIARARHWTAALERWCEQFSSAVMFVGICRLHRVQLMCVEGAWERADREANIACRELADINVPVVAEAHYQLGELRRLRGDDDAADDAYRRAADLGRDPEPGLSLLKLARGNVRGALAGVRRALGNAGELAIRRAPLLAAVVEIATAAGDIAAAEVAADELDSISTAFPTPGFRAWSIHCRGLLALRRGDLVVALRALRDARQRYVDLDAPYDVARVRTALGTVHRLLGDEPAAGAELEEASRVFVRLGAAVDARRTAQLTGARPAPCGLTARELEVLATIARGLTNKQAAAELFISERTVARHLANINLKVGLSTRTAVAAWAIEQGLVVPSAHN